MVKKFFTIIGGMGTEATEAYIHLLNKRTKAHRDQDYLNYILVNHATIPDRTAYILNHKNHNPLKSLKEDILQQNKLHPEFYVIPCNTAHYFYSQLQKVANAPILNMPREAVESIKDKFPKAKRVGLIATKGTIKDQIYDKQLKNTRYTLVKPTKHIENEVMYLIYHDIKDNDDTNPNLYCSILNEMVLDLKCDVVILGCTELSLAQERNYKSINDNANTLTGKYLGYGKINKYSVNHVIDAQSVLVNHSIKLAEKLQKIKRKY